MAEQLATKQTLEVLEIEPCSEAIAVGRTVLESLAQPVESYGAVAVVELRDPTSQPSTQRTWDNYNNRSDTQHMVDWD